jgi:hypothetical protein
MNVTTEKQVTILNTLHNSQWCSKLLSCWMAVRLSAISWPDLLGCVWLRLSNGATASKNVQRATEKQKKAGVQTDRRKFVTEVQLPRTLGLHGFHLSFEMTT